MGFAHLEFSLEQWWVKPTLQFCCLWNGSKGGTRSQFLYRLVRFAQVEQLQVRLAYYPPYHRKYNPLERCWGVLEGYWGGELLDSTEAVLGFARNMTYAQKHPEVELSRADYPKASAAAKPR